MVLAALAVVQASVAGAVDLDQTWSDADRVERRL
jgi:hypothetical protein